MSVAQVGLAAKSWLTGCVSAWDRFWFTPRLPHTLGVLRIAAGLMLLYSHLVLASDLMSFLGDDAWINNETARQLHDGAFREADWARSYLWYISSPGVLWAHHLFTIAVTACFAAGLLTRIAAPLAVALQLMYLHRLTGALFGLDQIVTYSAMYLMISPCGSCFSLDARLRKRLANRRRDSRLLQWLLPDATPSIAANIATRLLQLHLCVIYLFGGLSKARGQSWWDGTAMWYSVGNYEYQSVDMTWMASFPRLTSALTHATVCWEIFYCALVWPKLTRPIVLAIAVMVHGGIALFMGMITFGTMMIAANMIFIQPEWILRSFGRDGEGSQAEDDFEGDDGEQDLSAHSSGRTIQEREDRVRRAGRRVRAKSKRLKEREQKYRERVQKLKDREAKIKRLVERRKTENDSAPTENDE